jgi:hypothetical protein
VTPVALYLTELIGATMISLVVVTVLVRWRRGRVGVAGWIAGATCAALAPIILVTLSGWLLGDGLDDLQAADRAAIGDELASSLCAWGPLLTPVHVRVADRAHDGRLTRITYTCQVSVLGLASWPHEAFCAEGTWVTPGRGFHPGNGGRCR